MLLNQILKPIYNKSNTVINNLRSAYVALRQQIIPQLAMFLHAQHDIYNMLHFSIINNKIPFTSQYFAEARKAQLANQSL
jgi:hypothetical protein